MEKNENTQKELSNHLQNSDYTAIFNAANDAIFIHDIEAGRIIDANEKSCEMFCYPKEELLTRTIYDLSSGEEPYSNEEAAKLIDKAVKGEPQIFEWPAKDKAGRTFWIEVNVRRAIIGGKYRLLAIVRDINERKETEEILELTQFSIERAGESVLWVGPDAKILYVNNMECRSLGYSREELLGMTVHDIDPNFPKEVWANHWKELKEKGSFTFESLHRKKDGTIFPVEVTVNYLEFRGEEYNVAFVRNITERKKSESERERLHEEIISSNKKLKQLALKDPQTGLYNYRYLTEIIEAEFYRARRYGHPISLIMLDIDYFKSINDLYGREFGDSILKQFAAYLKRMVRRYDIVIRYGGEEFIIISPGTDRAKAMMLAQRLLDAIGLYNFGDKRRVIKLKVSIGIASYPEDRIMKASDLISLADKILNKDKEAGGNKVYSSLEIKNEKAVILGEGVEPTDVRYLKEKIEKLTKRGKQNLIESIFAFAKTIELKDHYTGEHVESTVHYSTEMARTLDLPLEEIENIRQASVLHDLGKVGISDKILLKKAKLTKREFEEIKRHPQIAADIIRPIQFMHDIIPLILYHHERWDGKGYPAGLKREEIPMGARIIAISDVYQALISKRPYRKAYFKKDAIAIIKKGSGTQFDPRIVTTFLKVLKKEK